MTETTAQPEDTILGTLLEHGLLADGMDWQLTPAAGGLNSRVFFVGHPGSPPLLTLRVSHRGGEQVLQREARILQKVAETCTCAPSVRALLEVDSGVLLVHDHVSGSPMPLIDASAAQLEALGACLAGIHSHTQDHYAIWPALAGVHGTRAQALADRLSAVERYAAFSNSTHQNLYRLVQEIYQQLQQGTPAGAGWEERTFSLLHGDLSHGNIIWNGDEVTLIDWEYVRPGDPAEDLAYLFAEQEVREDQIHVLARHYVAAGGDPSAISRIPAYSALVSLDSALWWADLNLQRGDNPAASPEVAYHLERARTALNDI